MIRAKIGKRLLVKRFDWDIDHTAIEVEVLEKAPCYIKVRVLSDGWFHRNDIYWLHTDISYAQHWFSIATLPMIDDYPMG